MADVDRVDMCESDVMGRVPSPTCTEVKKSTKGSRELFLKSVTVWINKPHVVNRRLCGTKLLNVVRSDSKSDIDHFLTKFTDTQSDWSNNNSDSNDEAFNDLSQENGLFVLLIRELIPKSDFFPNILEAVLYDKSKVSVSFIPLCQDRFYDRKEIKKTKELSYSITFTQLHDSLPDSMNEMSLSWSCDGSKESNSSQQREDVQRQMTSDWLGGVLLPKLVDWSHISNLSTSITSLQLVPVDKYKEVYSRLKLQYGRDLVQNWTESTDPKKFVYEDIAIAAYLLLIWEEDRELKNLDKKQSFVDLGCGNGLLVYILSREGHHGLGIDLRKRKIWDTFGPGVELEERAISPSGDSLFPDFDWIIGNHSDELTPWIPVITARSSYNTCFFLLPCCHHDFVGKYVRVEKGKSHYTSYLDYVKEVICQSGFRPECDTLRIPSTKRICYIGRSRTYKEQNEATADKARQDFIDRRTSRITELTPSHKLHPQASASGTDQDAAHHHNHHSETPTSEPPTTRDGSTHKRKASEMDGLNDDVAVTQWAVDFKPRVEGQVRNCQHVRMEVKEKIVSAVFQKVLDCDDFSVATLEGGKSWKKGGSVPLGDVANMFDKATLLELKSECGGLQTLLRNHSHVFQVTGGKVKLRDFSLSDPWEGRNPKKVKSQGERKVKSILCWFYLHHPDSCPRLAHQCTFAHGLEDLSPCAGGGKLLGAHSAGLQS